MVKRSREHAVLQKIYNEYVPTFNIGKIRIMFSVVDTVC